MSKGYPNILIHGFFGWGDQDFLNKLSPYFGGVLKKGMDAFLTENGYESYAPSVGPWSSAWDRSCELYAQIMGGTVDYGKAHSEKYGHARYGKTYKGYINDWGKPGDHEKINIIGHSFGGPTVIMFADLLDRGSAEERATTPANELSPLFAGGHANLLHTVTTLSGTNNGTTLADAGHDLHVTPLVNWLLLGVISTVFGETSVMKAWDFKCAHWGITALDAASVKHQLRGVKAEADGVRRYNANEFDNLMEEMRVPVAAEINKNLGISDKIYYFARRANRTHSIGNTPFQAMDLKSFPIAHISQLIMGWYTTPKLRKEYGMTNEWYKSDGPVNTVCTAGPWDKPSEEWTENTVCVPGKWYNMPVEYKDHFSWMGFLENRKVYEDYFLDMVDSFTKLPVIK